MTERELAAVVKGIVTEIRAQVAGELAPLLTRLAALEARAPRDGVDGRNGTDGRPGTDGRDGIDGRNGTDGVHGRDGRDAPTLDELRPLVKTAVVEAVATLPKAKDGVSLTGALIDRAGHLVLTRSEGPPVDVGLVTGAPGAAGPPGLNGKDAAFKGAIVLKCLDARTFEWCWSADGSPIEIRDAADRVIGSRFHLPIPIHKGVWSSGPYEPHDVVTHDGSQWLAKAATTSRPGNGASDWVLVVKRGAQGPKGDPGPTGAPGRDLTQMGLDGQKW